MNTKLSRGRPNKEYDLELAVLSEITNWTNYQWSDVEIAEVCDITPQAVRILYQRAKAHAWRLVHQDKQLIRELNESRGLDGGNSVFLPGP